MILTTGDEGQSFLCQFGTYDGNVAEDLNWVSLSDISQNIKNVTVTLSDNVDFDLSWL